MGPDAISLNDLEGEDSDQTRPLDYRRTASPHPSTSDRCSQRRNRPWPNPSHTAVPGRGRRTCRCGNSRASVGSSPCSPRGGPATSRSSRAARARARIRRRTSRSPSSRRPGRPGRPGRPRYSTWTSHDYRTSHRPHERGDARASCSTCNCSSSQAGSASGSARIASRANATAHCATNESELSSRAACASIASSISPEK